MSFWLQFILAALATWRLTHLLAREDGPADLMVRFRAQVGGGILGQLMDCFQCLSLWVAAPMALFVSQRPLEWLLIWLALSGAACLLERIGQEPVIIQPIPHVPKGGMEYGMLRSETSGAQPDAITDDNAGGHPIHPD